MFKSLVADGWESDKYFYILKDSTFTERVISPEILGSIRKEVIIINEYSARKLSVAKNVALLYLSYNGYSNQVVEQWLCDDQHRIDTLFPELKYGTKYYHCVVAQYKYFKKLRQYERVERERRQAA